MFVTDPRSDVRRLVLLVGVRSSGKKPKGLRFRPEERPGEGKAGRANVSEPLMTPRYLKLGQTGWGTGWEDLAAGGGGKRRSEATGRSCEHRWSRGIEGALPGRVSRTRNVVTPSGSGSSGLVGRS